MSPLNELGPDSMKRRIITSLMLLLLVLPADVLAWSAGGHRIIAFIAWLQLDAQTRAKAVDTIKHHVRFQEDFVNEMPANVANGTQETKDQWVFLQAAVWPDIPRGFSGALRSQFHRSRWHYVNLPVFARPNDQTTLDLSHVNVSPDLPATVANDADLNVMQALQLNLHVLSNAGSTNEEKALHLCWLMHLVGDMHQPMHSSGLFTSGVFGDNDGDRGGNEIDVVDSSRNLHSLWDNLLGNPTTIGTIGSRAVAIVDEHGHLGPKAIRCMDGAHWINESHILAKEAAYADAVLAAVREAEDNGETAVEVTLTTEYRTNAGQIARQRAVQAGFRLAKAIEELLAD